MTIRRKARFGAAFLAPAILLAACDGGPGTSSGPGGVSEGEARALDEAAEMLEERQLPDGVLPSPGADNPPAAGGADTSGETEQTESAQ